LLTGAEDGVAGFLAAAAGFLAAIGFAAGFFTAGFAAFFTTGFFAAFLAVFAMVTPLPALRNKTPGTDYSGEYSERKTETKPLTEKEKLASNQMLYTTSGRRG